MSHIMSGTGKLAGAVALILAASVLGSGCCTFLALSCDRECMTPVTVPVDIALMPVELLCVEVYFRITSGGSDGILDLMEGFRGDK